MTCARAEVINLNYWAHWIGEPNEGHTSDAFMGEVNATWSGARLFRHLLDRLGPDSAHLPLNLRTLHILIASRPALLAGRSRSARRLAESLDVLLSGSVLTRAGRDQVAGLHYAIRMAER